MSQDTFKALVLTQENGAIHAEFRQLTNDDLPQGDVLVQVGYSSLNYKDGLHVTGKGKISRFFPMVPGIDLAGTVIESSSPEYHPGDPVVLPDGASVNVTGAGTHSVRASNRNGWFLCRTV